MQITRKKTVKEVVTFHLTSELKYIKEYTNDVESNRYLKYTGDKLNKYDLQPLYDKDLTVLKKWNPYWGDNKDKTVSYEWFDNVLPEPEDIDLSKVIYGQNASHSFFTIDKKQIPVMIRGGYIEARLDNHFYDLESMYQYLKSHPNVMEICDKILDIPYYNAERGRDKYISVLVLPTQEVLDNKLPIFYQPYNPECYDFLGLKQFVINTEY